MHPQAETRYSFYIYVYIPHLESVIILSTRYPSAYRDFYMLLRMTHDLMAYSYMGTLFNNEKKYIFSTKMAQFFRCTQCT